MEERTQEYYMCGGDLHTLPPVSDEEETPKDSHVLAWRTREVDQLREAWVRQQEETEKWRQLYSVSRHQASRALDMLNSAKVQIEVLENKLNGRQ